MVRNFDLVGRSLLDFAFYFVLFKLVGKPLGLQDGKDNLISLLHTVEIQVTSFSLAVAQPQRMDCSICCFVRKLHLSSEINKSNLGQTFRCNEKPNVISAMLCDP